MHPILEVQLPSSSPRVLTPDAYHKTGLFTARYSRKRWRY